MVNLIQFQSYFPTQEGIALKKSHPPPSLLPTKDMENTMAIIIVLGWANLPEQFPFPAATEQNGHS